MSVTSLLLASAVTLVLGGGATAWLWLVQRPNAERSEGLKLLAAMRWREFSRLVLDGLRSRGFEPEAVEDAAERGQDSVIHVRRNQQAWLLACKHGLNYRITQSMVGDMADAIRFHGAAGGVVATLGEVESQARKFATGHVELFDGHALWPIVEAQLSAGVRDELAGKAQAATKRQIAVAWAAALTLGLVAALVAPKGDDAEAVDPVAAATPAPPQAAAPTVQPAGTVPGDAAAAAPESEDEQRDDVIRMVATVPGVERAMWSTRSTLLIYLTDESVDPVRNICGIMEKHEGLRTSRLHLQPPAGATRPARFLQCATY
ncbi:restriction endonuclease [Lysobacter solisilvae (ex Woo and Kim 2020)]|uniref:Restriction endonuclease n=1 Tax=Agrilutibacter terrestris TaxID=2865112 RepID=A0A7H0FY04_9GAMM|nr:restriction endonuclease [Lysobacter terrestris]QNP40920.1 restriction endonuclease [Lysobacter terrestris]